jgi:transcriptional regulator of acetoin/glycerol metabolism
LDGVAGDLKDTGVSLILTDDRGDLLDRRTGNRELLARLDRISLAPGFCYGETVVGTNAMGGRA